MILLRAPFVVVDPDTVIPDGALALDGRRVVAAGPARRIARRFGAAPEDCGDVVLAPGLVNAHTHLELSALRGRLRPTADFAGWVRDQLAALASWSRADFVRSYRLGVRLSLAAGTAAVGDICRRSFLAREALRNPFRTLHHVEVVEPDPANARWARSDASGVAMDAMAGLLRAGRVSRCHFGLSPHAPYTVSGLLYREVCRHARAMRDSVQTHLAETRAEAEFLRRGSGPLRKLLDGAGRPLPFASPPGRTPVAYLDGLGVLRPPLVAVHCNYLSRGDIDTLARRRVTVVFCPRSQWFFRHPPHPVRRLLRAGVPVALGTDSLASNRDLDLRAEMREVVERYGIRPREAWRMATVTGAGALGADCYGATTFQVLRRDIRVSIDPRFRKWAGTLRPGAAADVTVLARPPGAGPRDLLERLLEPSVRVKGLWIGGVEVSEIQSPRSNAKR